MIMRQILLRVYLSSKGPDVHDLQCATCSFSLIDVLSYGFIKYYFKENASSPTRENGHSLQSPYKRLCGGMLSNPSSSVCPILPDANTPQYLGALHHPFLP